MLALRFELSGTLGVAVPYLTLFPAVMFAAWDGGLGPGILAGILSVITASYFLIPPFRRFAPHTPEDAVRAVVFLGFSIFVSALGARNKTRLLQLARETDRRRRVEEELVASRDHFRTTLASIGDAVVATDAGGKVTFINRVASELTGWSEAGAAGKSIGEVFIIRDESTGLPLESPVERAIRDGVVAGFPSHTVLLHKDGRRIPIEHRTAPIRDEAQKLPQNLLGAVLVFRDVTERRRAEESRRASEEWLKLALEAGRTGVWSWDIARNRIEWSERVAEIFGIPPEFGSTFQDFQQLTHPDDRGVMAQAVRASLEDDAPFEPEFRTIHPTKGVRWLSNTGRVHRNEKGEPVRLAGAVVDITARKEVESALRQQWLTFDTALSNTPDFNYIFDLEGRFLYVNRARLRMFQMSLEQVVGKTFFELPPYSRERAEKFYAQIQQVIRTKETVRDQSPDTGPTGVTRQYEYILVPVLSADGEVEAVAGTTHDITDQKLVEQALRESQEGLKRTNRDLMRVNRELEEFDYVASHDLQEPLRMVNIYTELILREVPAVGTDLAQYAQFVQQGVKRMEGLIRDLLTFSRAVHAEDEPVGRADLSAALGDAISVLQSRIEENGAVIAAGPLPAVRADVSQISHVFQNLLSNALKYRKAQGAVEVRVSAEQNGSDWIVSVADNGIGFEPQYAERIFGLFKRLHKEEYPGTGLGLAICKRIVERHGGRIWAEGQLGHGATFRFSLPGAESPGFHDSQPPGI